MKSPRSEVSASSNVHSENIQRELTQLIDHLEADTRRVGDRQFRGLMEKSAEVLKGLRSLFERFGPGNRDLRTEAARRDDKKRKPDSALKARDNKSAPSPKKSVAAGGADGTNGQKNNGAAGNKRVNQSGLGSQKNRPATQPTPAAAPANRETPTLTAAAPKSSDPAAIAAKEQIQRKEARAPKTPGGYSAPRPAPPRSGKPVWSKPHSS